MNTVTPQTTTPQTTTPAPHPAVQSSPTRCQPFWTGDARAVPYLRPSLAHDLGMELIERSVQVGYQDAFTPLFRALEALLPTGKGRDLLNDLQDLLTRYQVDLVAQLTAAAPALAALSTPEALFQMLVRSAGDLPTPVLSVSDYDVALTRRVAEPATPAPPSAQTADVPEPTAPPVPTAPDPAPTTAPVSPGPIPAAAASQKATAPVPTAQPPTMTMPQEAASPPPCIPPADPAEMLTLRATVGETESVINGLRFWIRDWFERHLEDRSAPLDSVAYDELIARMEDLTDFLTSLQSAHVDRENALFLQHYAGKVEASAVTPKETAQPSRVQTIDPATVDWLRHQRATVPAKQHPAD